MKFNVASRGGGGLAINFDFPAGGGVMFICARAINIICNVLC